MHTVICVNDEFVLSQVEQAQGEVPSLKNKVVIPEKREGWLDFTEEIEKYSDEFSRPIGD